MTGPSKLEVGELMKCACCNEDMVVNPITNMAHDNELGYICPECRRNLLVAEALLKHFEMTPCQRRLKKI